MTLSIGTRATDLLTVVTATVGDSASHLGVSMAELRKYTNLPFRQIVSDDGTRDPEVQKRQRDTVNSFIDATWTENPGPTYGISYNLTHLFSMVRTPWAFIIEDAVRPGKGWLETAIDALERVGMRQWQDYCVGGLGLITSFDHWELAVAGIIPGALEDYFGRCSHETICRFWDSSWNDGLICWPRILPWMKGVCSWEKADHWPQIVQDTWRQPLLQGKLLEHPSGFKRQFGGSDWPKTRQAWPATSPGSWTLINMLAWRQAGMWRKGCTFYEGHLGVRLAQHGWLNVNIDCPPWLHYPSMAFHAVQEDRMGKEPRHHEPDNGPQGIFEKDFGCNGPDHCDLAKLTLDCYPPDKWRRIKEEMAKKEIYADPAWEKWM